MLSSRDLGSTTGARTALLTAFFRLGMMTKGRVALTLNTAGGKEEAKERKSGTG
jgi:hypothetical protein